MSTALQIPNPFPAGSIATLPALPNGIQLIVRENHAQPIVAMDVVVHGGSSTDPALSGVAHTLEHLCFQGTKTYPEPMAAQFALEAAGGSSTALTNRDVTRYQGQIAADKVEVLVKVLADIILAPLLTDDACRREGELIATEIARVYEDPVTMLVDQAYAATYRTFPYRNSALGRVDDLSRITPEILRKYHRRWYVPKNISVVLVGDITKKQAVELVRAAFGSVPAAGAPSLPSYTESIAQREPVVQHLPRDLPATCQVMAFPVSAGADPATIATFGLLKCLLADIPGALLPERWRKDGVSVRRFGIDYQPLRFPGRFMIWAQTSPEMAENVHRSTLELLSQISNKMVSSALLERAKQQAAMQYLLSNETFAQQASTLAFYEGLGDAEMAAQVIPELRRLTTEQLCKAVPTTCLAWITLGQSPKGRN